MGKTIIEKIFSEHAGRDVAVNEDILIYPDLTCAYELPAYMERFPAQMKEFGVEKPKHPERVVIGLDHCYPGGTPEEQEIHKITWAFVKKFGYHIIEGEGISHQVIAERFLKPGMIVTHHDGHACLFGALCAALFPLSAGIIEPLAMESLYLTCPPTVRVNFHGALSKGVAARDVQMWMLQQIGPSGAMNACVEMGGDGFASLTMDDRFTICNQVMFLGAKTAVCEQDEHTWSYLRKYGVQWDKSYSPDADAVYWKTFDINLDEIPPMLLAPPKPANVHRIDDFIGRPVQAGLVGSCASGRIEDFKQVLEILDGKHVKEGFRLVCVPSTIRLQQELVENGMMAKLIRCGARMHYPSCDFCYGKMAPLATEETCLADAQINAPGRLGSKQAEIFTASPYAIAAAELTGEITDPRGVL